MPKHLAMSQDWKNKNHQPVGKPHTEVNKYSFVSYPETPKQYIEDAVINLKEFQSTLPVDSINYLVMRRVITDIEHTAKKLC